MEDGKNTQEQVQEVSKEIETQVEEVVEQAEKHGVDPEELKRDLYGQFRKNIKNLTGVSYEKGEDPFKFLARAFGDASKRQENELNSILETTLQSKSKENEELVAKLQELQSASKLKERNNTIKNSISSLDFDAGSDALNELVSQDLIRYFNDNVEEKDGHYVYKGEIVTNKNGAVKNLSDAVKAVLKNKVAQFNVSKKEEGKKLPSKATQKQPTLQERLQSANNEIRQNGFGRTSYNAALIYKKFNLTKSEVPSAIAVDYPQLFD